MGVRVLWAFLALIILGLQYRLWVGEGSYTQAWVLQKQIEEQEVKNKKLQERNNQLSAEVSELKLAKSAIEERARNQLGMTYPEETFYWLIESE